MTPPARTSLIISCLLATAALSHAAVRFVHATPENTRVADRPEQVVAGGEPLEPHHVARGNKLPAPDGRWHWWIREGGEEGVFAAAGAAGNNAPLLRTLVTGLEPNANYEVYGFFGVDLPKFGDIRLGLSIAGMEGFAPDSGQGAIDLIGVQHPMQRVIRIDDDSNALFVKFRASLGVARTDADGTLVIFVDDHAHDRLGAGTLYAGIGVSPAPQDTKPDVGAGSPQVTVDATRAADSETLWREIAAGANLNTPDREGRTALFYACIGGDHELAAALLEAGAKPDCEGQRLPPLWAAAHLGDTRLVRMLLDAGAEITTECLFPKQLGTFGKAWSPNLQINPVSAAVLSGCTETLDLLLKHDPRIDVEKAAFGPHYELNKQVPRIELANRRSLIEAAIQAENFEMAAWLVRHGLFLELAESWNLPRNENLSRTGPYSLLLSALLRKTPQMSLVEALASRGVPMIDPVEKLPDPVIVPWDALSAASFRGHIDLVRRWLPSARDVPLDYRMRLITLADASGCDVTAELVREAYPGTPRSTIDGRRTRWQLAEFERIGGADGVFVPRTKRVESATPREGTTRLAVIGTGPADGPATALAVLASNRDGVEVVDREEIRRLLDERSIVFADLNRGGALNVIGDLLKADVIVTASALGEGNTQVFRFEAHAVLTGLAIHRAFQLAAEFKPEDFARGYLDDMLSRCASRASGDAATAITLIGVTADGSLPRGTGITATLNAGLLQEIDATPGLIALTREQLAPLVQEQALGAAGGLWGAAWMVEGGIRAGEAAGKVSLTLRATSATGRRSHDVSVSGFSSDPRDLVTRAWASLREALDFAQSPMHDDPERARREAARLAREAEWLLNSPLAAQAAPLADAAFYLGGPTPAALMLRLDAHWARSPIRENPRTQWGGYSSDAAVLGYPVAQDVHDYYLTIFDSQLELLLLTLETAERQLASPPRDDGRRVFHRVEKLWMHVDRLTAFRCRISERHAGDAMQTALAEFDRELARLWEIRIGHALDNPGASFNQLGATMQKAQRMTMNFRKLPWLGDFIMQSQLEAASTAARIRGQGRDYALSIVTDRREIFGYLCRESLADLLEKHVVDGMPHAGLRRAETGFLRASGPRKTAATRAIAKAWTDTLAAAPHPPSLLIHRDHDSTDLPSFPRHGFAVRSFRWPFDLPLYSLVSSPRHCPDMLFRQEDYLTARLNHLHASHLPPNQIDGHRRNLARNFTRITDQLVELKAGPADYDLLMDAAREIDRAFGSDAVTVLAPVVRKLRPSDDKVTFGMSGGFRYLSNNDALLGLMVADVRADVTKDPAFITLMRVDPADRHIIWIVLQPYENRRLVMHRRMGSIPGDDPDRPVLKQPWLLAFDGKRGDIIHRVNLIEAGFGAGAAIRVPRYGMHDMASHGIAFNDGQLLVALRWVVNGQYQSRALVLNRDNSGIFRSHPLGLLQDYENLTHNKFPQMQGLGRDFFIIERNDRNGKNNSILRISPGVDAAWLNQPGRRPSQSPFDDIDRNPLFIRNDQGRLLVASSWNHLAYYDVESGTWSDAPPRKSWRNHVRNIDERHQNQMVEAHLNFPVGSFSRGKFSPPSGSEPGSLTYIAHHPHTLRLPVNLHVDTPYPSVFMISPGAPTRVDTMDAFNGHLASHPPEEVSIQDLSRSDMVRTAVIHQTDDDLLLMQYLSIPGSFMSSNNLHHLPFIWKIEKARVSDELLRLSNER